MALSKTNLKYKRFSNNWLPVDTVEFLNWLAKLNFKNRSLYCIFVSVLSKGCDSFQESHTSPVSHTMDAHIQQKFKYAILGAHLNYLGGHFRTGD